MIDKIKEKDLTGKKTKFVKGKKVDAELSTSLAERTLMNKLNEVIDEVNSL